VTRAAFLTPLLPQTAESWERFRRDLLFGIYQAAPNEIEGRVTHSLATAQQQLAREVFGPVDTSPHERHEMGGEVVLD
jgi:hypothetical protein